MNVTLYKLQRTRKAERYSVFIQTRYVCTRT